MELWSLDTSERNGMGAMDVAPSRALACLAPVRGLSGRSGNPLFDEQSMTSRLWQCAPPVAGAVPPPAHGQTPACPVCTGTGVDGEVPEMRVGLYRC